MRGPESQGLERFGPYLLVEQIGDGGMAEIHLAKLEGSYGFEKLVALKRIHPRYSAQPVFADMLIQEAKLAAAIQHLNVVQVLDLGEVNQQVFIAMEYVRGRDLASLLSRNYRRRERLPIPLALFIATEFLSGLDYAHRLEGPEGQPLGLIHRDVSPQNILISYEGEVKMTDFGIARVFAEELASVPGDLHGKFGYMAPEQLRGLPSDQRVDVFAAGVVLYETLVGRRLFRAKTPEEASQLIFKKTVAPPSQINREVPSAVDEVCLRALARDRDERYQTIGAMLGDLSRIADGLERRAARRDLAVYMRRAFGTLTTDRQRVRTRAVGGKSQVGGLTGRRPIGEILIELGAVNDEDVELALAEQRARGGRIGEIMLESGVLGEDRLAEGLARQASAPAIGAEALAARRPVPELLAFFPREVAQSASMLPLARSPDGKEVELVTSEPFDTRALLEAKVVLGVSKIKLLVSTRSAVQAVLRRWYDAAEAEDMLEIGSVDDRSGDRTGEQLMPSAAPSALTEEHDSVSGRLEEMSALDIIHTLEQTGGTAEVTLIYGDGRRGRVGVWSGEVRGCVAEQGVGEEAFYALSRPGSGLFKVEYVEPDLPRNIELPNTLLILEALAQAEEPVVLREQNLAPRGRAGSGAPARRVSSGGAARKAADEAGPAPRAAPSTGSPRRESGSASSPAKIPVVRGTPLPSPSKREATGPAAPEDLAPAPRPSSAPSPLGGGDTFPADLIDEVLGGD